jgi:uncharacterized membrane protein YkvA (DUF1232 family)
VPIFIVRGCDGVESDERPEYPTSATISIRGSPASREIHMLSHLRHWARRLSRDGHAVYLAARDPRVPWYAKCLALAVAGYALSPIDLIPDFIPVIGYLDDLIIVPLGIRLVVLLIPDDVMAECRARADAAGQRPVSRAGMIAIIAVWIAVGLMVGWIGYVTWNRRPKA